MINKRVSSELAVGIIILLAIIVAALVWKQRQVENQQGRVVIQQNQ